jgi:hypothetical protein
MVKVNLVGILVVVKFSSIPKTIADREDAGITFEGLW